MIALRKTIALILAIFLLSAVMAASISVESPIPQGVGWSFTIDLGALDNVDSAKVFVDNELAMELFEFSGTKYVNDSSVSSNVMDYSLSGNKLTISYSAMQEGSVDVSLKTYDGDSVKDTYDETVEFFIPLDKSTKKELEEQIYALELNMNTQSGKITDLQTELSQKDTTIESLKNENASLLNSINAMQTTIGTLESEGKSTDEQLSVLKSDLNSLVTEQELAKKNNPINAMFAFNDETNGLAAGALVVLVILVVVAVVLRNKGDSIYSGFPSMPKFENPFKKESDSAYNNSEEEDLDEQADEVFKGKWAFIDEESK